MYPKVILKGIFCVLPDNFLRFAWQATEISLEINGKILYNKYVLCVLYFR